MPAYLQGWEKNQRTGIKNRVEGTEGYQVTVYQYQVLQAKGFQKHAREPKGFKKALSYCLKCCTLFEIQNGHHNYFKDDAKLLNDNGQDQIELLRKAVTEVSNHEKYIGKHRRARLVELGIELHPNALIAPTKKKRRTKAEMMAHRRAVASFSGSDSTSSVTGESDEEASSSSEVIGVSSKPSGRKKKSRTSGVSDVPLARPSRKKPSRTDKRRSSCRSKQRK